MGKAIIITKITAIAGAVLIAISASATPKLDLNVGGSGTDVVGEILPGYIGAGANDSAGQAADESSDANAMIPMALGTSQNITTSKGVSYVYRSLNNFGTLPYAVVTGNAVLASGGGMTQVGHEIEISIGASGFTYLVARWDGPNAGAEVWDISGIANTDIYIPADAAPDSTGTNLIATTGQYGITSYSLFQGSTNPPPPPSVPEVASTLALLGGAVASLTFLRKKISSK
ncbi:MAG TPA: hypothetical protein VG754_14300 [Verrucomicrobiae bacterium]|nr:hypothetical protein [Verrucomicrobiae bacterium]